VRWDQSRKVAVLEELGQGKRAVVRNQVVRSGQSVEITPGELIIVDGVPLVAVEENGQIRLEAKTTEAGGNFVQLEATNVSVPMPGRAQGSDSVIVNRINLDVQSGDFVALMGTSGAGKTTFLEALAGRRDICGGRVLWNDQDLHAVLESKRSLIGYVPQDDILHPELTAWEAIRFSARLRLDPETSDEEIDRRVEETLKQLQIDLVKARTVPIGRPEDKGLSGGQRKRVNIGLELVADPPVLLLDEPTSGLGADDTEKVIADLAKLASETKKLVIAVIHQPAREEFEKFTHTLIMATGGELLYQGVPAEAYRFFSRKGSVVSDPRGIFSAIRRRQAEFTNEDGDEDPIAAARMWRREFEGRSQPRPSVHPAPDGQVEPQPPALDHWLQWRTVFARYALVKWRDQQGALIQMVQPFIIAVVICGVFLAMKERPNAYCMAERNSTFGNHYQTFLNEYNGDNGVQIRRIAVTNSYSECVNALTMERATWRQERESRAATMGTAVERTTGRRRSGRRSAPEGVPVAPLIPAVATTSEWVPPPVESLGTLPQPPEPPTTPAHPPVSRGEPPPIRDNAIALFFLVISACWFGASGAAREIVGEQALYRRERMINLTRFNYVTSKFLLLAAICAAQCFVLLVIVGVALHLGNLTVVALGRIYFAMWLASLAGVATGLLISSWTRTSEAALAWMPILLIPQVVLGGRIVSQNEYPLLKVAMWPVISRWAYELAIGAERIALQAHPMWLQQGVAGDRNCALREVSDSGREHAMALGFTTYDKPAVAVVILIALTSLMLAGTVLGLRASESRWKHGG
jgi:ABC-type multidrug transport system ATPase subunit